MEGHIKWFNTRKGYGFITTADGNEVFVHKSQLKERFGRLKKGSRVQFRIREGKEGPEAADVEVLSDKPPKSQ